MASMPPAVLVVAALDTKAEEAAFLREELRRAGCRALLVDVGMRGPPGVEPDVTRDEVVELAGGRLSDEYPKLLGEVKEGLVKLALNLLAKGELASVIGINGGVGTFIATAAMRALPFGLPKFMLSTVASRDVGEFVDTSDICMMHCVVDLAGLNDLSRRLLSEAAWAVAGMVKGAQPLQLSGEPRVGVSMFGYTTHCVEKLRLRLRGRGLQMVAFHANGVGGSAMEEFVKQGLLDAVLDVTLHELLDAMYGGFCGNVKPNRLEEAGRRGIPLVAAPGGLDCIVLRELRGELAGRPHFKKDFRFVVRSSREDLSALAKLIASKLGRARGPTRFVVPLKGWSEVDAEGTGFYDRGLIDFFVEELKRSLSSSVPVVEVDAHINEEAFADALMEELEEALRGCR
jgi:uncharacterized protein (UPF0261 family)